MLPLMSPQDVKRKLEAGEIRLVDIREPDEVESLRIEGAEIAPLSVIRWQDFRPVTDKPVVFTCNSGRRTKNNSDLLEQLAAGEAWQMEGGATAWDKAGLPVVRSRRSLPMFRQIQIGAGGMVLLGLALSLAWPQWLWLSAFVGDGLLRLGSFAGPHAVEQEIVSAQTDFPKGEGRSCQGALPLSFISFMIHRRPVRAFSEAA